MTHVARIPSTDHAEIHTLDMHMATGQDKPREAKNKHLHFHRVFTLAPVFLKASWAVSGLSARCLRGRQAHFAPSSCECPVPGRTPPHAAAQSSANATKSSSRSLREAATRGVCTNPWATSNESGTKANSWQRFSKPLRIRHQLATVPEG